ncbi:MAG: hypothetical protein ISN64_03070 [Rickettsia sp.]|nr:hypothetical protein [Rickettsia sp.]
MNYIAVSGISGRMGIAIRKFLDQNPEKYSLLGGMHSRSNLLEIEKLFQEANVILDFSITTTLKTLLKNALLFNKPLLIGTTGYSKEDFTNIVKASKNIAIFYSPNFSISLNLIADFLSKSKFLLENFDFHITDIHHRGKKDAPSGSSKYLKDKIGINISQNKSISQTSIRIASMMPEHSILFANNFEQINIKHKILNYDSMIKNIFLVLEWFLKKNTGFYNLNDFIKDNS